MTQQKKHFTPYDVQWHEGMLLMPHHFQKRDRVHKNTFSYHLSVMSPYHWGVRELSVDRGGLSSGVFRVLSFEGILPDGTIVFFPHEDDHTLEIDLNPYFQELQTSSLKIFLGIPESHTEDSNEASCFARYKSVRLMQIADENTGDNPLDISFLRPNLRLFAEKTIGPPRYVSMAISQVCLQGSLLKETSYIPPQLRIQKKSAVGKMCAQLIYRVREKIPYLQEKIQHLQQEPTVDTYSLVKTEETRRNLITGLLNFETIANGSLIHPYHLFLSLVNFVALSASMSAQIPPVFKAYDHNDVQASFEELSCFFYQFLDGIEATYTTIDFKQTDRVYSMPLKKEWDCTELAINLYPTMDMSQEELVQWVNGCVIATDRFVYVAQDNRVLGASREVVKKINHLNIVPVHGSILVRITGEKPFVYPGDVLRMFNISDKPNKRPERIVLYLPSAS